MTDGGACSSDPFRLPAALEELTYPFGNGLVVHYGHTSRLVAKTVAVAGVGAELPPTTEDPYRLLYFVVSDHVRTAIAVLRAVLKERLAAPGRPSKAMVIDTLHTLEVFRKQGLATSLTNFVKGIAGAHGIGLYATCGGYTRTFWELRGFEEERLLEMQSSCNRSDQFAGSTVLLRAGAGYTEYLPGAEGQLSTIRRFNHSQTGDEYADPSAPPPAISFLKGGQGEDKTDGGDVGDAAAATRFFGEAPTSLRVGLDCSEHSVVTKMDVSTSNSCHGAGDARVGGGAAVLGAWDSASSKDRLGTGQNESGNKGTSSVTTAAAAAAAAADGIPPSFVDGWTAPPVPGAPPCDKLGASSHSRSVLVQPTTVRGWPGTTTTASSASKDRDPMTKAAGGCWLPLRHDDQPGAAAMAAVAATTTATTAAATAMAEINEGMEQIAAKALTALPGFSRPSGSDGTVDLTGGEWSMTAQEEEEEMQMAIALSLSMGREGAGERQGDDTETDEEAGYGAQLSAGEGAGGGSCGALSEKECAAVAHVGAPDCGGGGGGSSSSSSSSSKSPGAGCHNHDIMEGGMPMGGAGVAIPDAASSTTIRRLSRVLPDLRGGDRSEGLDGDGSRHPDSNGFYGGSVGGGGRGRGSSGIGEQENDFRRLRRRRDKNGASTPGEQSPEGGDGGNGVLAEDCNMHQAGGVSEGAGANGAVSKVWFEGGGRRRFEAAGGMADNGSGGSGSTRGDGTRAMVLAPSRAVNTDALAGIAAAPLSHSSPSCRGKCAGSWAKSNGSSAAIDGSSHGASTCSGDIAEERAGSVMDGRKISSSSLGGQQAGNAMGAGEDDPFRHSSTQYLIPPLTSSRAMVAPVTPMEEGTMMAASKSPEHEMERQNETGGRERVDTGQNAWLSQQHQKQQPQHAAGDDGSSRSLPRVAPTDATAAATAATGTREVKAAAGGGFMNDLETHELWRDLSVAPGGGHTSEAGTGDASGAGALDTLLAVANWEKEDGDEELRRAVEASRRSHEEESLLRATQESHEAAVAASAAAAATAAAVAATARTPTTLSSSSSPFRGSSATGASAAAPSAAGGPGNTILPPFMATGSSLNQGGVKSASGRDSNTALMAGQTNEALSGGRRGGLDNGWQVTGGEVAGSSIAAGTVATGSGVGGGGGVAVDSSAAAWLTGWEEGGEMCGFAGKGKGRCREGR